MQGQHSDHSPVSSPVPEGLCDKLGQLESASDMLLGTGAPALRVII